MQNFWNEKCKEWMHFEKFAADRQRKRSCEISLQDGQTNLNNYLYIVEKLEKSLSEFWKSSTGLERGMQQGFHAQLVFTDGMF